MHLHPQMAGGWATLSSELLQKHSEKSPTLLAFYDIAWFTQKEVPDIFQVLLLEMILSGSHVICLIIPASL